MYYRYFGLSGLPFQFTPSATNLFESTPHREALAALEWGLLHEPSGFTLLIGEPGTGKTTLVYAILARNYERVRTVYLNYPMLGFEGMLRVIIGQLGLQVPAAASKLEHMQALERYLTKLKLGRRVVIIVDEAQSLCDEVLEELRLLSNCGRIEEKQLHFVLVGQPELLRRLESPALRQINDRAGARAMLSPLQPDEARAYVAHRLAAFKGSADAIFAPRALRYLVDSSGGIPRRINVLCHNAMLLAYSAGTRKVEMAAARGAVKDYRNLFASVRQFRPSSVVRRARAWLPTSYRRPAIGAAALGLLAICMMYVWPASTREHSDPADYHTNGLGEPPASSETRAPAPAEANAAAVTPPEALPPPAPPAHAAPVNLVVGKDRAPDPGGAALAGAMKPATVSKRRVLVHRWDSLARIAMRYLGSIDELARLEDANPQIRNPNHIEPGEVVYLPNADGPPSTREY